MHLHSACRACGARLPVAAAFCSSCGAALDGDELRLEAIGADGGEDTGGDVALGPAAGRRRTWQTLAVALGAVAAIVAGLTLFSRRGDDTATSVSPTTLAGASTTSTAPEGTSTTVEPSPPSTTAATAADPPQPFDRPLAGVIVREPTPFLSSAGGIELYLAATGAGGQPAGLYRIDLETGVAALLDERGWTERVVTLFGVPYGAVIAGPSIDVVTRVGVAFSSGVAAGDVVAPDPDGVHAWTTGSAPSTIVRLRVDGGGVERELQLPEGVHFAGLGADGAPLVRGPVGGTFRVDPDSGAVIPVSEGLVLGAGPQGIVELVCDDGLVCRQQLRPADGGTPVPLAEGELALRGRAAVSPDGGHALFLVSGPVDGGTSVSLVDLATGATRALQTPPELAVQLAPVELATDGASVPSSTIGWSADGSWVTFVAGARLYAWSVEADEPILVEGIAELVGAVLAIAPTCAQQCG